ncbi:Holliday junction DNA helicase subunit RuvA [Tamaricihabitans halophyticus]|uniref:Holliday junction branch migration complex subunit RuvA n=1 Tax=Tamaricihabitans halophyticus TaxID=1262583 RepID=A0A4R2QBE8_9PSEU|nr:Holliday junction branch migration protein RuvA [Tamaricihabitans halophyticus]TCP46310.1 Holliday junction DNA helicase subunit RuvA [Tamaricihabitans halophyticus]
MISTVRGTVLDIALDHAVIEVGGLGIAVLATPGTLATLRRGEQAQLHTALVVRDDNFTLYGFPDLAAKELFGLVQTVSGIGPRIALAMLAVLEPDSLRRALADENITALTQVPGIGRKGAERLVLELRDKVDATPAGSTAAAAPAPPADRLRTEVTEALIGLGFAAKQAEQAVDKVTEAEHTEQDTSTVLRAALATLGRKR